MTNMPSDELFSDSAVSGSKFEDDLSSLQTIDVSGSDSESVGG